MSHSVKHQSWFNFFIGLVGAALVIAGNFFQPSLSKQLYYLSGAFVLLLAVVLERNVFFTILQLILVTSNILGFINVPVEWKGGIPIVLTVIGTFYLIAKEEWKNGSTWLGVASLLLLTFGYTISGADNLTFVLVSRLLGSIPLAIYSFMVYRQGVRFGLLFGLLNTIFVATALYDIYLHHHELFIS